jgi:ankyrin repeat protein
MKRILLLALISINMIQAMEKQGEPWYEQIAAGDKANVLCQMLGEQGSPSLKFLSTLSFVKQPASSIKNLHIPEELKDYVLNIKQRLGKKLLALLKPGKLSEDDTVNATMLIEAGADVNIANKYGGTALMMAAKKGRNKVIKILVNNGADVNVLNSCGGTAYKCDGTALILASYFGNKKTVKILINNGADVNAQQFSRGWTPLITAIAWRQPNIVKLLLDAGADPDIQCKRGMTALAIASEHLDPEIVKLLIEAGADTTVKNDEGKTALDLASTSEIRKLLKTTLPIKSGS